VNGQYQITVPENAALSLALRALKIPHTIYDDEEGHSVMTITLNSQSDYDLLQLWRAITNVQYQYIAQVQHNQHVQLTLPIAIPGHLPLHTPWEAPHG